jgi:hypothetical protein
VDAVLDFAQRVREWCFKHPSDTSGWSCLLYLIPDVEQSERSALVRGVLDYTFKLNLENESIWVFIRTIIAHEALYRVRSELCSTLQEYSEELKDMEEVSELPKRVNDALEWIEKYGVSQDTLNGSS